MFVKERQAWRPSTQHRILTTLWHKGSYPAPPSSTKANASCKTNVTPPTALWGKVVLCHSKVVMRKESLHQLAACWGTRYRSGCAPPWCTSTGSGSRTWTWQPWDSPAAGLPETKEDKLQTVLFYLTSVLQGKLEGVAMKITRPHSHCRPLTSLPCDHQALWDQSFPALS